MVVAVVWFHKTIDVASPPSRVFDLVARPGKAAVWQPWTSRAAARQGERLEDGGLFDVVNEALGMRFAWTGVAEIAPPRRLAFHQVAGDFQVMEGEWELHERRSGDATDVRLSLHVALPFVLPRMVTATEANQHLSAALDDCLFNLKTLIEEGRPTPPRVAGWGWYPPVGHHVQAHPRPPMRAVGRVRP